MVRALLSIVVVLVVLWVLVKLVFGIVGAVFHLLLAAAVVVGLLVRVGATNRIRSCFPALVNLILKRRLRTSADTSVGFAASIQVDHLSGSV